MSYFNVAFFSVDVSVLGFDNKHAGWGRLVHFLEELNNRTVFEGAAVFAVIDPLVVHRNFRALGLRVEKIRRFKTFSTFKNFATG